MTAITLIDFVLFPIYFLIFYAFAIRNAAKQPTAALKKYYLTSFLLHVLGSLLFSLLVQYYYGYGDAFTYYFGGEFLRELGPNTGKSIGVFFMGGKELFNLSLPFELNDWSRNGMTTGSSLAVMKTSGLLSYFSFHSFLVISMGMGILAFAGQWKLFITFNEILKSNRQKLLAYAVLYTPSIWFWGSGLGKDALSMGALGYLIYFVYKAFFKNEMNIKNILSIIIFFAILFIVKSYIAAAFLAAFGFAGVIEIIKRRKGLFSRLATGFVLLIVIAGFFSLTFYSYLSSTIEDSAETIEVSKKSYENANAEDERSQGSFESKEVDVSMGGFIIQSPLKVFSTLFRPFIWEARKPIMLFSALESLTMFLSFLYLLYLCRFIGFFRFIFSNSFLMFSFMITVVLAVMVGFTTFNFGTMVRYRLPLLPFYFFLLLSIYNKLKPQPVRVEA